MHKFNPKSIAKLDNPDRRQNMPPLETLRKFKIGDYGTFLDVGCGTGYFSSTAAEIMKDGNVIGIDILDEMIEVATARSQGFKNLAYRKSEEYSFPISEKSVEYVFVSNVLHEIEDKSRYLGEIKRVLKSKGFLCIIEWDKKPMEMGPPMDERISVEELMELASTEGLIFKEKIVINTSHYGVKFERE